MHMTRRAIGSLAAGAVAAATLIDATRALANPAEEAAVSTLVEALREAIFKADKAQLEALSATTLSYGHSAGRIENKAEFVAAVVGRKAVVKSLKWTDVKITVTGNTAVVRHGWESVNEAEGKTTETKIGVLQVWQKFDGKWQLYARQAFRLGA